MSRFLAGVAMIGAATLIALPVTYAQSPNPQDFSTRSSEYNQSRPTTLFRVGPFDAVIDAPAAQTGNSNIAYQSFEGRPANGRDTTVAPMPDFD